MLIYIKLKLLHVAALLPLSDFVLKRQLTGTAQIETLWVQSSLRKKSNHETRNEKSTAFDTMHTLQMYGNIYKNIIFIGSLHTQEKLKALKKGNKIPTLAVGEKNQYPKLLLRTTGTYNNV